MAHSPSHRPTNSFAQKSLQPPSPGPTPKQQRRMTSPASTTSLNPPEAYRPPPGRPPSPLRNGFVPDTFTGIDPDDLSEDEDDDEDENHFRRGQGKWPERSPSPSSSVSQLAASFTQRVGSFLGNMAPRSGGGMPTDAEIEAEAERERERGRREAERILTREAQERKLVEERVLAMMESTRSLPPPPSRSQTMPNPTPPSPATSQKEKEGPAWWTAAKNKLTPTKDKDPLTPAQQVILEAKSREKDKEKKKKGKGKERDKDKDAHDKSFDSFMNLSIPQPPHRRPVPGSPSSPTPSRPNLSNLPPNLTPSPMRSLDAASASPSREAPLLYAQFNTQGTLDVPATLLTIAKRFEKLEKWTVGHVRALEDRMSDVERWLVDKEKEKDSEKGKGAPLSAVANDLQDMKDSLSELQGRVGELGREMAKLATSPSNLSSGPSRQPGPISIAPHTASTMVVHDTPEGPSISTSPVTTPQHSRLSLISATARESTSPPMASAKSSGTRLPYPTGDYATPPGTSVLAQGTFSPPHSPPSSITSATRARPLSLSLAGLPSASGSGIGLGIPMRSTPSTSSLASTRNSSPQTPSHTHAHAAARAVSPSSQTLPPPKHSSPRPSSASPTPRKRYTVALGEPIVSPPDPEADQHPNQYQHYARPPSAMGTAFFSNSPGAMDDEPEPGTGRGQERERVRDGVSLSLSHSPKNEFQDDTIGKSASGRFSGSGAGGNGNGGDAKSNAGSGSNPSPSSNRRIRAQSAYGYASVVQQSQSQQSQQSQQQQLQPPQTPIQPLRPRIRSRSTERSGSNANTNFNPNSHSHSHSMSMSNSASNANSGVGLGLGLGLGGLGGEGGAFPTGKFVDPLVLRRQDRDRDREGAKIAMPKPVGKIPIGQLVAFFDGDKRV
ncbi:hypothetical protein H0H81_011470 [Sphagnurus paluster]|uniref:Uncharacterized protein n=1 Tax=Sphagnurus paluster TaxID=117069 RepID=A0A9P7FNN9_9AGAR|nr:hypothetical protein H0H81_011470 [Sphagnurus paluster]